MTALSLEFEAKSLRLEIPRDLSREEFFEFCQANPLQRIERDASGDIQVMSPTGTKTGGYNSEINGQLYVWSKRDGTGRSFDSNTGFELPNGAVRSPDTSWVPTTLWTTLSQFDREHFAPICPHFVVELRSPSDRLPVLLDKMEEYLVNGARLGLLIDPTERKVHICRPGTGPEVLDRPNLVGCDPEMPGLTFDLTEIWSI